MAISGSPSCEFLGVSNYWVLLIRDLEEVWFGDIFKVFSETSFGSNECFIIISKLDMIEVTIGWFESWSSSKIEYKFSWWGSVMDIWNCGSFIIAFRNENIICFLFSWWKSRINIEPIAVNIMVIKINWLTTVIVTSGSVISTEVVCWFFGWFPWFELER